MPSRENSDSVKIGTYIDKVFIYGYHCNDPT